MVENKCINNIIIDMNYEDVTNPKQLLNESHIHNAMWRIYRPRSTQI